MTYTRKDAEIAVDVLLHYLGYDSNDPSIRDTPARVVRAYEEMTQGQHMDPAEYLARVFPAPDADAMIAVTGVTFTAVCEHHMLPFTGEATVAYLPKPGADVVGLSKLARVVDVYAQRLTMQERLVSQITAALDTHLDTLGSACLVRSSHACMALRGVRKAGARMVTSSLTGVFRTDPSARSEFLALAE